jgi:hypothetical protein
MAHASPRNARTFLRQLDAISIPRENDLSIEQLRRLHRRRRIRTDLTIPVESGIRLLVDELPEAIGGRVDFLLA